MSKTLQRYFSGLRRQFQLSSKTRQQYLYDPVNHFSRKRKLCFDRTACLVLGLLKKACLQSSLISLNLQQSIHPPRVLLFRPEIKSGLCSSRTFSSYKVNGVQQELWATFALFNILTASQRALKSKIKTISTKLTYPYRLNRNVGLGYLKRLLPYLIVHPLQFIGKRLDRLLELILSATEPVRKKNRTR